MLMLLNGEVKLHYKIFKIKTKKIMMYYLNTHNKHIFLSMALKNEKST